MMRRVGVHLESIALDDSAKAFDLDRPWSEDESELLQGSIDMVYDRFLSLASKSRGIELEQLKKLAGGRVWSGAQAKDLKLVDSLGGVDDCLAVVARKADLEDYKVIHRPVVSSGLDLSDLLGQSGEEEIWQRIPVAAIEILKRRGVNLNTTKTILQDGLNSNGGRPTTWLLSPLEISIR